MAGFEGNVAVRRFVVAAVVMRAFVECASKEDFMMAAFVCKEDGRGGSRGNHGWLRGDSGEPDGSVNVSRVCRHDGGIQGSSSMRSI